MKSKLIVIFLAAITVILTLHSCRYKEGPCISFRTANNRLLGDWEVTQFNINGIDCTYVYNDKCDCKFHFNTDWRTPAFAFEECKPDGRYIHGGYEWEEGSNHSIIHLGTGTLDFYSDTTLNYDSPFTYFGPIGNRKSADWKILKLKYKEAKLQCNYEGYEYTVRLKNIKH